MKLCDPIDSFQSKIINLNNPVTCLNKIPEMSLSDSHDEFLVRVRAQVMTRDDSSGGWVPLGGGGLSNVSVRKRTPDRNEYLIHGKRISDQSVVLSCTIKKDFEYNKVMPTFHHWKTGEKKFGLTFQTAADARAFDKGVRMAIEDLMDGMAEFFPKYNATDIGDDDVFMTLDLPVEIDTSSSGSSSAAGSQNHPHPLHTQHLHRMYFSAKSQQGKDASSICSAGGGSGRGIVTSNTKDTLRSISPNEKFCEGSLKDFMYSGKDLHRDEESYSSYVQFGRDRPHEYSYPVVHPDIPMKGLSNSASTTTVSSQPKKPLQLDPFSLQPPPLLPTKSSGSTKKKRSCGKKRRCRDCHEVYSEDANPRGSCEAGPDPIRKGIDGLTCMGCARGMLYHCVSGAEGDIPEHPCALTNHRCKRRWLALTLLSLILPCLCLYIPLASCHKLGKYCKICGARHHPS